LASVPNRRVDPDFRTAGVSAAVISRRLAGIADRPLDRTSFTIAGVFLDYGSEHGRILLHRSGYERYWHDPAVGSAAVFATPGENLTTLRERLQEAGNRFSRC
jgi:hypothetical protein